MEASAGESPPRAWAEVDLGALEANFGVVRGLCGDAGIMAVVKAGAYGHGMEQVARVFEACGAAFIGVANAGEARRLAGAGIRSRLYLLGATWRAERAEVVARGWTPCISTLEEAADFDRLAASAGVRLRVHLAVDTGMGRGGFLRDQVPGLMEKLSRFGHLEIEGIGSHLPSADEDEQFTRGQIAVFHEVVGMLGGADRFRWRHLLNSAGIRGYDGGLCNLVRPGLMLYGAAESGAVERHRLLPAMSLKSRVTLVRTLPAGHGVSYGRDYITTRPTRVATVGIGYGDGYPRHVSGNGAEVSICGARFPVIGRVTMDQTMVDVTADPAIVEGDEVEMFGARIPVTEVAGWAGTISWEVFTGITPRVVRCYLPEVG